MFSIFGRAYERKADFQNFSKAIQSNQRFTKKQFTQSSPISIVLNITSLYENLNVKTLTLKNRTIHLIGESYGDPSVKLASVLLADKAAKKQIVYFHEGVPVEQPYERDYITHFFHRPLMKGSFSLPHQGYNYGLEKISFFIPYYLSIYHRALSCGNRPFVDIALADIIHFNELRPHLKQLADSVNKICTKHFSVFSPCESEFISRQTFQKFVSDVYFFASQFEPGEVASFDELVEIKKLINPYGVDMGEWAFLIKKLLQSVLKDQDKSDLFTQDLKMSFEKTLSSPLNQDLYFYWLELANKARTKIFADRIFSVVTTVHANHEIAVSIGKNHLNDISEFLLKKEMN